MAFQFFCGVAIRVGLQVEPQFVRCRGIAGAVKVDGEVIDRAGGQHV